MRFNTNSTSLSTSQSRQSNGLVIYRGTTNDTNINEIFLDGVPNRRLVPDLGSTVLVRATAIRYRPDNHTGSINESIFWSFIAQNGNMVAIDQDSGTAGAQNNPTYAFNVTTRTNAVLSTDLAVLGSYGFDNVQPSSGIPGFIRLQVRAPDANRHVWEVKVEYTEATSLLN